MLFSEFAHRYASVMKKGNTTSTLVKTLFEAMLPTDKRDLLNNRLVN